MKTLCQHIYILQNNNHETKQTIDFRSGPTLIQTIQELEEKAYHQYFKKYIYNNKTISIDTTLYVDILKHDEEEKTFAFIENQLSIDLNVRLVKWIFEDIEETVEELEDEEPLSAEEQELVDFFNRDLIDLSLDKLNKILTANGLNTLNNEAELLLLERYLDNEIEIVPARY